jgi:hypothetical protein
MKRLLFAFVLCIFVACSCNSDPARDGGAPGALERPTDLSRSPDGGLPPDLFPPRGG